MSKVKRVQFIFDSEFWNMFKAFRIVSIEGRFGGGKTLLAVTLAMRLLAEGQVDKVVGNIPCIVRTNDIPVPLHDSAIILDESWIYLSDRNSVQDYAAFVRKFNHFLLLPSVWPPHPRLRFLIVERHFNAYALGVPIWVYRWQLMKATTKERGYFGILNPHRMFGTYPTDYVPGDDEGVSEAIKKTSVSAGYKGKRLSYTGGVAVMEGAGFGYAEVLGEAVDAIEEAGFEVEAKANDLERVSERIRRKVG